MRPSYLLKLNRAASDRKNKRQINGSHITPMPSLFSSLYVFCRPLRILMLFSTKKNWLLLRSGSKFKLANSCQSQLLYYGSCSFLVHGRTGRNLKILIFIPSRIQKSRSGYGMDPVFNQILDSGSAPDSIVSFTYLCLK